MILRFLLLFTLTSLLWSQEDLTTNSFDAGILMEESTGRILWSQNPDMSIAPASLTKIASLSMAWEGIKSGRFKRSSTIRVPQETAASAMEPGSSLMFLEAGTEVSLWELMEGMAVSSGNDAAETLAVLLGGTRESFMENLNQDLQLRGFKNMVFYDPAGLDSRSRITPREYAFFCRDYIQRFPESLAELHNLKSFTYPPKRIPGTHTNPINQSNRNLLVGTYPGADGLKTGYIDTSGYHMAATAQRDGMRLIALILGVHSKNSTQGSQLRAKAASQVLDWGFDKFSLVELEEPTIPTFQVLYSLQEHPKVKLKTAPRWVLSKAEQSQVEATVRISPIFEGPLPKGSPVGDVVYTFKGEVILTIPLVTVQEGNAAPWWVSFWQYLLATGSTWFGGPAPVPLK